MKDDPVQGVSIRVVLLAGFGSTLGLWLFAGYQVTERMKDAQRDATVLNARYLRAQALLSSVRTQVLVASVYVRDALLDPAPRVADDYRRQVERSYQTVDASLAQYETVFDSATERERIARLRGEVDELRTSSTDILSTDSRTWQVEARTLLRRFMPKRNAAIRVSEEVQEINRALFIEHQSVVAENRASMQRQVWTVLGVALAISLAIAWLAFHHSTKLEARLRAQRVHEAQVALDLQRLSATLVHAREEEQRRIARELHDEVGQALSAVQVELAVAQQRIQRSSGAGDLLRDAQAVTERALRGVRNLSHLLHPSVLDDLGLAAALESYVNDFGRRYGIRVDFVHEGVEGRLGLETERAVYRIVREALANVTRHAQARTVSIRIQGVPGRLQVVVQDDGVGFDAALAERPGSRRGLGLLGIRERAAQLHGAVRIESAVGSGTRIEVELPDSSPPSLAGRDTEPVMSDRQPMLGASEVLGG